MATTTTIKQHRLSGGGCRFKASPNHGNVFAAGRADTIVIHFTAGSSFQSSIDHLCSESAKASAHLVIGREGQVTQLVPFDTIAWHAGDSQWRGRSGLNQYSIGIELDNAGELKRNQAGQYTSWFNRHYEASEVYKGIHRNQSSPSFWHEYTELQIEKTFEICNLLHEVYAIGEIVGHEEIAPGRKTDPGPAFPLDKLRMCIKADRSDDGSINELELHRQKIVLASKLNIRSGPGTDFMVVAKPLVSGDKVKVLQKQGEWSQIEFSQTGWVNGRYLKEE
ncbi:N-acetylmuramoyl-L-alanine amidase [Aliiglaciecola sp. LCG003]|uniref:N-acetylmuramoyl-L-alanine amidase n=1 Tax=Aliiglaciecola sp. LCG003 TaxID=3053655 RepID=UPI002572E658|nr:N-acetylmuramoyl-L-alanine amidase [Aliiglaciecola sp. LCG003]WJG08878.1 N-acetylmuramoyl-L-alanine amidase [Aliiglaciecola sp. LCG003]